MSRRAVSPSGEKLYTIGEVSEQLGLHVDALRRMDRRGEFKPSAMTPGGQRRYSPDDVVKLRDLQRLKGDDRSCVTLSFVNIKGGVGKSTLTITIASALALKGFRVLVVDLDPQANATLGMGLHPIQLPATMAQVLAPEGQRLPISDVIQQSDHHPRLFIAPSHLDLATTEARMYSAQVRREVQLDKALDEVRAGYDYILVDSPPTISNLLMNVMTASDGVIVPVDASYSLSGVGALQEARIGCAEVGRHRVEMLGAVLNKQVQTAQMHGEVLRATREIFGDRLFRSIIPLRQEVEKAGHQGIPVVFLGGQWGDPYLQLADEIRKVCMERFPARGEGVKKPLLAAVA